ncbi:MAG: sulfatase-like hydrolase/transferase [Kiritimatiellaeota bacterium]|nr:sulfatase-like hydrolase/transferase [Kiritimatiellota bacterium]
MAISRRLFLGKMTKAGAAVVTPAAVLGAGRDRRPPNIIYIMADEIGYYELSCMGHPHMRTPNLDRLAAEGVRFTQALAGAPVCAPTRCCFLTGKHMGHTSVRTNWGGDPMRAGEPTVGTVLRRAGYAVGGFGKWGCGGRGSTGVPEKNGFDVFFGYYDQVHAHSYYPPYLIRNSREAPLPGNRGGHAGRTYSHYAIMEEAKKFIRDNRERPFFCYLPVTPPHGWFDIPDTEPSWRLYKDKPWPRAARVYAAMVHMLDRNVGEIVGLLRDLGIAGNTVVFFSGDNGGMDYFRDEQHPRGFHAPNVNPRTGVAFRGHKGNLYEGGLRIPMIAWWPGRIRPGRVSDSLWYFPDFLPTAAELAGVRPPRETDGVSIVPELLAANSANRFRQPRHEFLYWEMGMSRAVRLGHWKAVYTPAGGWELFDLNTDIEEKHNVAGAHPQIVERVKEIAARAHEPARPGRYFDFTLEKKDRMASGERYWGPPAAAQQLPEDGLIPRAEYRIARVSSESRFNGKLAVNAIDGAPRSIWHTRWKGQPAKPPHEIVLDLGGEHTVSGIRYLARQDSGWNGGFKDVEIHVGNDPDRFPARPAAVCTFRKTKKPQEVRFAPTRGRYVGIRILSEINGGIWASAAEIGVVGE